MAWSPPSAIGAQPPIEQRPDRALDRATSMAVPGPGAEVARVEKRPGRQLDAASVQEFETRRRAPRGSAAAPRRRPAGRTSSRPTRKPTRASPAAARLQPHRCSRSIRTTGSRTPSGIGTSIRSASRSRRPRRAARPAASPRARCAGTRPGARRPCMPPGSREPTPRRAKSGCTKKARMRAASVAGSSRGSSAGLHLVAAEERAPAAPAAAAREVAVLLRDEVGAVGDQAAVRAEDVADRALGLLARCRSRARARAPRAG